MFFATLFDKNYIPRAELMMESLIRHLGDKFSGMFVLALDGEVVKKMGKMEKVTCISISELEDNFPELASAKANRSPVEYIFTLSPFLPLFVLQRFPQIERITSLDSDLYFFSNPAPHLEQLGKEYIGITAHDFPPDLDHLNRFGRYNVSFQSFPNTPIGLQCLGDWGADCLEYCGDELDEKGRFADQQYLDHWKNRYGKVEIFETPQVGLAPWNIFAYPFTFDPDSFLIQDKPVVFYHFQGIRMKSPRRFHLGLFTYTENKPSKDTLKLYQFYLAQLLKKQNSSDLQIKRLQHRPKGNAGSWWQDLKTQPVLFKLGSWVGYWDLRKAVDFLEKKFQLHG